MTLSKINKEKAEKWIKRNGCASFDFKNKDIIFWDGGLFAIEKEIKIKPKTRIIFGKMDEVMSLNGKTIKARELKFIPLRKNGRVINEEVEYYKAIIWFQELDETINYFISMKKMLNKIGFQTRFKPKNER